MDAILLAHAADAYESVTGERDYDAAAGLLAGSGALRAAAGRFARGQASEAELRAALLGAMHNAAGERPYGDLDMGGEALLMDAIGQTAPTTAENAAERTMALEAYLAAADGER